MAWKFEPNQDPRGLYVLCEGSFNRDDLMMLAMEASYLVREHGHSRLLIDFSGAQLGFPLFHLAMLVDMYAEQHLPLSLQTGLLLSAEDASRSLSKFLQAARDYGYKVDMLTVEQAKHWLREPS